MQGYSNFVGKMGGKNADFSSTPVNQGADRCGTVAVSKNRHIVYKYHLITWDEVLKKLVGS
jgi:hypothetical protein